MLFHVMMLIQIYAKIVLLGHCHGSGMSHVWEIGHMPALAISIGEVKRLRVLYKAVCNSRRNKVVFIPKRHHFTVMIASVFLRFPIFSAK